MTTDFYNLLLTDCALALILLALFWYVSRVARGVRGIASQGTGHFFYSVGAAILDGTATGLERTGSATTTTVAAIGGMLACGGLGRAGRFGDQVRPAAPAAGVGVDPGAGLRHRIPARMAGRRCDRRAGARR
ncbi:hypothetical protein H1235_16655 [Pseudoxanthomonas sp. NC8]|nr:hypothetical protein H1235_16655 [Pseudoxanthomonas sp. NC8]